MISARHLEQIDTTAKHYWRESGSDWLLVLHLHTNKKNIYLYTSSLWLSLNEWNVYLLFLWISTFLLLLLFLYAPAPVSKKKEMNGQKNIPEKVVHVSRLLVFNTKNPSSIKTMLWLNGWNVKRISFSYMFSQSASRSGYTSVHFVETTKNNGNLSN